jgi:chaperonin GroES
VTEFKQKLLGDLIAVEPDRVDAKSKILLPDWQRILRGTVLAIGPGRMLASGKYAPMMTKVGDRVIFGAATGMESAYSGTTIRIMHDLDCDAVERA